MSPRGRLFVALISTLLVGYVAVGSLLGRVLGDSTYGHLAVFNEVLKIVLDAYVDPVNVDRAMGGARLGLTEALDGDSAYLDAEEFRAYQHPQRESEAGVGVILTRRFAFLMVVSVKAGSPAERAGLRPGDLVKTIDGRHTRPLAAPVGERLLRGAPGSVVKLTILRAGSDPLDVSLVRERLVPVPPQHKMLEGRTGYLKVAELPQRAAEEIRSQLDSLKRAGASRLILDLRGTGHGVVTEAVKAAELFLKGGVVTKLKGETVSEQVWSADPSRAACDLPMAVLIDSGTSGPAEVLAAALLESQRSAVVGERSFGRAAFQKAVPLDEGGLVVTVARYMSPKGNAIHGKGVEPSVPVERSDEDEAEGPPKDRILEKALEVLAADVKKAA
jgi:carboxyl-terminal processing protease